MNISKKKIVFILFLLLILLFFIVIAYLNFSRIGTDGAFYAMMGENIAEGKGYTLDGQFNTYFPPLFSIIIGGFFLLFKNIELASHISTIFFGLLSVSIFYFFLKSFFSEKIAIMATIFFAFNGVMIWSYATLPTPQIVVSFLSIISFFLLIKLSSANRQSFKRELALFFLLGFLVGLLYLTRPEYFFIIFPISFFIYIVNRRKFSSVKIFLIVLMLFFGFTIISFPYINCLHSHLGKWTISGKNATVLPLVSGMDHEEIDYYIDPRFNSNNIDVNISFKDKAFFSIKRLFKPKK